MRVVTVVAGVLMAVAFPGPSAFAQSATTSYPFCLLTGPDQECAFNSMAQCMASRHGNEDFCEPNNQYSGYAYRQRGEMSR